MISVVSTEENSRDEMKKLVAQVQAHGVSVEPEIRYGDVYDEIKRDIEAVKPDLIVMGTHGRRGFERWFLGSTTEKLLRHSPVPIVTISAAGAEPRTQPRFNRILVTTDFSDGTADALAYAFSISQENQSKVVLLHVSPRCADGSGRQLPGWFDHRLKKSQESFVPVAGREMPYSFW
jgi:nucleotide-binding universal stress UspA family protein